MANGSRRDAAGSADGACVRYSSGRFGAGSYATEGRVASSRQGGGGETGGPRRAEDPAPPGTAARQSCDNRPGPEVARPSRVSTRSAGQAQRGGASVGRRDGHVCRPGPKLGQRHPRAHVARGDRMTVVDDSGVADRQFPTVTVRRQNPRTRRGPCAVANQIAPARTVPIPIPDCPCAAIS